MGLLSFFKSGNYFDKGMTPKCDYCQNGKRARDGNKVLCEKRGLVDCSYSCSKFIYSPLKRIPVKQLNFVGSLADEDIYIESAGDRAEREKQQAEAEKEIQKKAEAREAALKKQEEEDEAEEAAEAAKAAETEKAAETAEDPDAAESQEKSAENAEGENSAASQEG
jgi:hypothetical protein